MLVDQLKGKQSELADMLCDENCKPASFVELATSMTATELREALDAAIEWLERFDGDSINA